MKVAMTLCRGLKSWKYISLFLILICDSNSSTVFLTEVFYSFVCPQQNKHFPGIVKLHQLFKSHCLFLRKKSSFKGSVCSRM